MTFRAQYEATVPSGPIRGPRPNALGEGVDPAESPKQGFSKPAQDDSA